MHLFQNFTFKHIISHIIVQIIGFGSKFVPHRVVKGFPNIHSLTVGKKIAPLKLLVQIFSTKHYLVAVTKIVQNVALGVMSFPYVYI
jgi:hypothetical protein